MKKPMMCEAIEIAAELARKELARKELYTHELPYPGIIKQGVDWRVNFFSELIKKMIAEQINDDEDGKAKIKRIIYFYFEDLISTGRIDKNIGRDMCETIIKMCMGEM